MLNDTNDNKICNPAKARVIAFYLPQYHPIPENNSWWGPGFTEWTNVASAKPIFKGHQQPKIPADLGFYDLRLPEVRELQADMARSCGIEGFCYWHYWFGNGKTLLERPFLEVLHDRTPNFPFCLGWANHSWTNATWQKKGPLKKDSILIEQRYDGEEDYRLHFDYVLPALLDERYITVDGKPLFFIYEPMIDGVIPEFISLWQTWAKEAGLKGIHFVGRVETIARYKSIRPLKFFDQASENFEAALNMGLDAIRSSEMRMAEALANGRVRILANSTLNHFIHGIKREIYDYDKVMKCMHTERDRLEFVYPTIIPRWDRTPRRGLGADLLKDSSPQLFKMHAIRTIRDIQNKDAEHKIIFLQSWNEWGEGNYMEPDMEWGRGYLDALREALEEA